MAFGLKGLIPFPPPHFPQRQNCIEKGFDPDFHLVAWSKPYATARHYRLTSLSAFALLLAVVRKRITH